MSKNAISAENFLFTRDPEDAGFLFVRNTLEYMLSKAFPRSHVLANALHWDPVR